MKSVCFFNNKGGVGKTTLVCNVAAYLTKHKSCRVLLIDADPQCNSTQLIVPEKELATRYSSRFKSGSKSRVGSTLYDIMEPIAKGDPTIASEANPILGSGNNFELDLMPGDPKIALLEDQLSQAWISFGAGEMAGARKTNWSSQLLSLLAPRYDLIFFDVGPSLGALNRSILVGVDYFVTPMGCDIFSIAGVDNISLWLRGWLKRYSKSLELCKELWGEFDDQTVRQDAGQISRFLGYTVQQYITKTIQGERRATRAYETILKKIPAAIEKELGSLAAPGLGKDSFHLGDVPNMYSLVPLAQNANSPIAELTSADGLVGTQFSQRDIYTGFIQRLAEELLSNAEVTP